LTEQYYPGIIQPIPALVGMTPADLAMNRKELVRAYKETARPMGIYRVHNTRNDRSFVGRSVDLPAILNRERMSL
jgi:hypothetical protein